MIKFFTLGLIVGLALFVSLRTGASRASQKNAEQEKIEQAKAEQVMYEKERVDATPVQAKSLTEKQRLNSKHFAYYQEMRGDEGITSFPAQAKRLGHKMIRTVVGPGLSGVAGPKGERKDPKDFFAKIAQLSDLIIRGKVIKKTSQVTENDGFLYTDYDVSVQEVIKDNSAASVSHDSVITVAGPGGKVLLDEVVVIAIDENLLPLPINDHDVVLFLKYIPETGAYCLTQYSSAYELDGSRVEPLTHSSFPAGLIQNSASFLDIIRSVSAKTIIPKKSNR